jgi:hypothetical protein
MNLIFFHGTNRDRVVIIANSYFYKRFTPSLRLTQPLNEWVPDFFPPGQSGHGLKLTTRLQLAPRLRMNGAIPPVRHMDSQRRQTVILYITQWPCLLIQTQTCSALQIVSCKKSHFKHPFVLALPRFTSKLLINISLWNHFIFNVNRFWFV